MENNTPNDQKFQIIRVPDKASEESEQLGTKEKFWYWQDNKHYLFKAVRPHTGEHWSEKVACELCRLLRLPHAYYELAVWKDRKGVITPSIVSEGQQLVHGNELLAEVYNDYPTDEKYRVKQHTLKDLFVLMNNPRVQLPLDWEASEGIETAFDVFIGYLLLDTWIANQDRHHENWAFIITKAGKIHLAATFDHGAALGRNESDANRRERLETRDKRRNIAYYVTKARSAIYDEMSSNKPLHTLTVFLKAAQKRPLAGKIWLNRLKKVSTLQIQEIFAQIPVTEITPIASEFAQQILALNQKRLLQQQLDN
jgi:hypothetical protein